MNRPPNDGVVFETEGNLLLSRKAPYYLFAGSAGTFLLFLGLFRWVCNGYGVLSPTAISSLLGAVVTALGGNLVIWKAMRSYRVRVTQTSLILSPSGGFAREAITSIDRILDTRLISRSMHGTEAKLVEVEVVEKREPLRLVVKDPIGLVEALKRAAANRNQAPSKQMVRISAQR